MKQLIYITLTVIVIASCSKKQVQDPAIVTYKITSSSGLNGTITPVGESIVASGRSWTYTITPDSGYAIATLTIDGTSHAPASTFTFADVTASHTISVTFDKAFTITSTSSSYGAVSPLTVNVVRGGTAAVAFIPNTGFHADSVWLDGVYMETLTGTNGYTFNNVTANHTIRVVFNDNLPQSQLDSLNSLLIGKWTMVKLNSKLGNLQDHAIQWDIQPLAACSSDQFDQFYANGIFQRNGNPAACDPLAYPQQQFKPRYPNHWTFKKNGKVIYLSDPTLDSLINITVTKDSLIAFYYGGFDSIRGISYLYHYARKP